MMLEPAAKFSPDDDVIGTRRTKNDECQDHEVPSLFMNVGRAHDISDVIKRIELRSTTYSQMSYKKAHLLPQ